jgi:hypothetical protein
MFRLRANSACRALRVQRITAARPEHCPVAAVFLLSRKEKPMTARTRKPSGRPPAPEEDEDAARRAREKALDKALEDTFPASDPVAPIEPAPSGD